MNIKELTSFIQQYDLKLTQKLVKYLIIIGISAMKIKTQDISIETIKLIANSCKQQKLRASLANLKERVNTIEQTISPRVRSNNYFDEKINKPQLSKIFDQFSPIKKKEEYPLPPKLERNVVSEYCSSKQQQENIFSYRQHQKYNEYSNNYTKKMNLDQIANKFLNSPLIKNPQSARNINHKSNELQYFFQNSYKEYQQF